MSVSPGQSPLCRSCRHWSPWSWRQGHPSPCARHGWAGDKRISPKLGDGECSEYVAVDGVISTTAENMISTVETGSVITDVITTVSTIDVEAEGTP